jgi:sorbitol/mannitol transport system permease protein
MFFFLSTKMLRVVAALLPIYLLLQNLKLLDNIWALGLLYTSMNLPAAVWMMRSFLGEVPVEILEAAVDGQACCGRCAASWPPWSCRASPPPH